MFEYERWREVFEVLLREKLRAALTAFGVFWGIFMLVLMLGFGNGLRTGVFKSMGGMAQNSVFMWGRRTSIPYGGLRSGRSIGLRSQDVKTLSEIDGVKYVCPRNQLGGFRSGNSVKRKNKTASFQVMGDVPEYRFVRPMRVVTGRFLNRLDEENLRKVAIVGSTVQKELFDEGEAVLGGTILVNGVYFEVVGVVESLLDGDSAEQDSSTIHIPFSVFQRTFKQKGRVGWIALVVDEDVEAEEVEAQSIAALARAHRFDPKDPTAIGSWNAAKEFKKIQNLFLGIQSFVWFVGVMTLLSGVVGVSNIMLISVRERVQEFGIRRAFGATPLNIVGMVLSEAVVLTTTAGIVGVVFGVMVLEGVSQLIPPGTGMFDAPYILLSTALWATGILAGCGMLAGLIPARTAVNVPTVVAIRS